MAADSKREVVRGIFALGVILPAALCTFGVVNPIFAWNYISLLFAIPRSYVLVDRFNIHSTETSMHVPSSEQ